MVELLRIAQRQLVPHVGVVAHSHEVIIPRALDINIMLCEEYERDDGELVHLGGDHEEAKESI